MECLTLSETPKARTYRPRSPLKNDISPPPRSKSVSPLPRFTPTPSLQVKSHQFNVRSPSPHLSVAERLNQFSLSCSDLLANISMTSGLADNSTERGEQSFKESAEGDITEKLNASFPPDDSNYSSTRHDESQDPVNSHNVSARNLERKRVAHCDRKTWEELTGESKFKVKRRTESERGDSWTSPRLRSHSCIETPYDNYHSTSKQSCIVPPRCITPINTSNLFYSTSSRPVTPVDVSDLLHIPSRSPSPEQTFFMKPVPPRTRTRSTSPLKVNFEGEEDSCSRCSKAPLRTSTPKPARTSSTSPNSSSERKYFDTSPHDNSRDRFTSSQSKRKEQLPHEMLKNQSISPIIEVKNDHSSFSQANSHKERPTSPYDDMLYIPGTSPHPSVLEGGRPSMRRDWSSGYDSDGDRYATANTTPEPDWWS